MALPNADRVTLVQYRAEKALETLKEAEAVSKMGFWSLTANRLYYATYYACASLLLSKGHEAATHAGVSRMISLNYVRTGILNENDSLLLKHLFMMRQTGDYDDLFDWDKEDIEPLIPEVKVLVGKILSLVEIGE
ncbi:MAG: HEPN domain-containing protein [Muribaculaceae bacterium]|nr:HEPN domain-containing protein [Muribaculaceae bacterium]